MTTIKLVVDSTADLNRDSLEKYDIRIVPAFVNFGEESYADDGIEITRQAFYERLVQSPQLPTTSAPPPGLTEKVFREVLAHADHVIAISVAASLSSIYNGMVLAAKNVSEDNITVVDSGSVTMGAGWQVLAAAEAAIRGANLEEIKAAIASVRPRVRVYAVLDTLEYLKRSGRVGWVSASLGSLLQIKPVVELIEGRVDNLGRVRTFKNAMQKLVELAHENAPLERLAILHSNAPDRAESLRKLLQDIAPADYTVFADVNTALGTHVGPGALGLAIVKR